MLYQGNKTKNISFPLGGIGTGCIGLAGNGELNDWEIFNRPNKNTRNGYSHFAIRARVGEQSVTKVLHGDTNENLLGGPCINQLQAGFGFGPKANSLAGYPHFKDVTFEGNFPMASLTFSDEDFPAQVRLQAFNPFIPHDEDNSSLPAAFFAWEVENDTQETMKIDLACTVRNPAQSTVNKKVDKGLMLQEAEIAADQIGYCDLCVLTDCDDSMTQSYWYRGRYRDGCTTYWKNLSQLERMPERTYDTPAKDDHGTVVAYAELAPGEKKTIRFVIAWNVPNNYDYWEKGEDHGTWRNFYATQFADSHATAAYAIENFTSLYAKTLAFSNAMQESTLPAPVKDAISANLSVLKTPTTLRLEDGSFWGWEGCSETIGSCLGTCQHVWNYAYAMPYLFPRLERSIREMTMNYALSDTGATEFRINLPLTKRPKDWNTCLDGQMGEVIKCYREWKFSGDDAWLKKYASRIFSMLEYAWSEENPHRWDRDMDGVLEGRQHHTLDLELFGPSSWLQGFYLLALRCAAEMARHLGEDTRAALYEDIYEKGKKFTNDQLFNGKYFYHKVDLADKSLVESFQAEDLYWNEEAGQIKYQVAEGCIIDQVLADWHAAVLGMDGVFEEEKKKIALKSLYENNFKKSMRSVTNMWRNFALNDEAGTIICAYPEGAEAPAIPISYCEETMTGFEYALAGLMIAEGYVAEGEELVKAVRDRYDGEKRNPWNEIECGSNYARSMASFALMPIYSGFTFDMTKKHIGFAPITGGGKYLFSAGDSWGKVAISQTGCLLTILGAALTLNSISVPMAQKITKVTADGVEVAFKTENGKLLFDEIQIKRQLELQ